VAGVWACLTERSVWSPRTGGVPELLRLLHGGQQVRAFAATGFSQPAT
jgi:hypothetical protein